MASKSRGGLSKNEVKKAAAAKVKVASLKPAAKKATTSKPTLPANFIGPLQTGQQRGYVLPTGASGPLRPGIDMTQKEYEASQPKKSSSSSSSSNNKVKASKVQASFNKVTGIPTAEAASMESDGTANASLMPTKTRNLPGMLFDKGSDILKGTPFFGAGLAGMQAAGLDLSKSLGLDDKFLTKDSGLATYADDKGQVLDVPGQQSMYDFSQTQATQPYSPANYTPASKNFSSIYDSPTAPTAPTNYTPANKNFSSIYDQPTGQKNFSSIFDQPALPTQTEESVQSPNDMVSPPPVDSPLPGTGMQRFGAGRFANGGGLPGNPAEDNYIKELRKAYSGNDGIKELRKQFEELIKQLDPTYDALQKEGTDALAKNLNDSSNQLAAVMNAGNVGDSEQRTQQLGRLQGDNSTALGNLLAKLAQSKAGDVSNLRSQMQGEIGKTRQQQQQNQIRMAEAIQAYRQQQQDNAYRYASLSGRGGSGAGSEKNDSFTQMGVGPDGTPIWYNNRTKQYVTDLPQGTQKAIDPIQQLLSQLGQNQGGAGTGGSWEFDPQTGERVWVTD